MKKACSKMEHLAWALLIIGGLNWGLVGLFEYDLVDGLFGGWPWLARLIYVLVGLSAVMALVHMKSCGRCKKDKGGSCEMGSCGHEEHAK